jgi:hypothetical protein
VEGTIWVFTSQNTAFFVVTAVKTSNLTLVILIFQMKVIYPIPRLLPCPARAVGSGINYGYNLRCSSVQHRMMPRETAHVALSSVLGRESNQLKNDERDGGCIRRKGINCA